MQRNFEGHYYILLIEAFLEGTSTKLRDLIVFVTKFILHRLIMILMLSRARIL